MNELTINGERIQVEAGTTLLDAARRLGIEIPTMCYHKDLPRFASCMICIVKDAASGRLLPSCSAMATGGMAIITDDEEVREARKTALELLLSDHVGDCEAPCTLSCPAHMDIPMMNRHLAAGEFEKAYQVVIRDIALPSILGRICPAPCEKACRRKSVDEPVSICLLKRFAGDEGSGRLKWSEDDSEKRSTGNGSAVHPPSVAVIGSGPHGLSAAWYLQQWGYQCTIFDKNEMPGGALRYSVPREKLPLEVLDREIERIRRAGARFEMKSVIAGEQLPELESRFDAVIEPLAKSLKMAIWASALGKEDAVRVHQALQGTPATHETRRFMSRFGRLKEAEIPEYLKESVATGRILPAGGIQNGYTVEEVMAEAARCLHCECRKLIDCKLRLFADLYGASQKRFAGPDRKNVRKIVQHDQVVYEPEKCIKCGICVRITTLHGEELGLTFIGRGFDVEIGIPFNETLQESLARTALLAADSCPTGALARKERNE